MFDIPFGLAVGSQPASLKTDPACGEPFPLRTERGDLQAFCTTVAGVGAIRLIEERFSMKKWKLMVYLAGISVLSAFLIGISGCDTDSSETLVREVEISIDGFYLHPASGSFMVPRTSGEPISNMNLIQNGDQLSAFDNHGLLYRGSIGRVLNGTQASITLRGKSTAGTDATISGIVVVSGSTATMEGTWLESSVTSPVFAQALVPTNALPDDVDVTPAVADLDAGGTQTFTASEGSGGFNWSLRDSSLGTITTISGSRSENATYTALELGVQTITATDGNGNTDSASITQTSTSTGPPIP